MKGKFSSLLTQTLFDSSLAFEDFITNTLRQELYRKFCKGEISWEIAHISPSPTTSITVFILYIVKLLSVVFSCVGLRQDRGD